MDEGAWSACFDSQSELPRIEAHKAAGAKINVNSTPTFVINGEIYQGPITYDAMRKVVDSLIAAKGPAAASTMDAAPPAPPVQK